MDKATLDTAIALDHRADKMDRAVQSLTYQLGYVSAPIEIDVSHMSDTDRREVITLALDYAQRQLDRARADFDALQPPPSNNSGNTP